MKAFCCQCGRPVAQRLEGGEWKPQRCKIHPDAKRFSLKWAQTQFEKIRWLVSKSPALSKGGAL